MMSKPEYATKPEYIAMDQAIRAFIAKDGQIATGWVMAASSIPVEPGDLDPERLTYQTSEGCGYHQALGIAVAVKDQLQHPGFSERGDDE